MTDAYVLLIETDLPLGNSKKREWWELLTVLGERRAVPRALWAAVRPGIDGLKHIVTVALNNTPTDSMAENAVVNNSDYTHEQVDGHITVTAFAGADFDEMCATASVWMNHEDRKAYWEYSETPGWMIVPPEPFVDTPVDPEQEPSVPIDWPIPEPDPES